MRAWCWGRERFVITLLAPVGAQLVQRRIVHPRILLFGAVIVVGISMLHYSHMNLQTDYGHYAWARALQGLGYAFFFVPLSVIAYSQLAPNQNNKASSLTNFFRNWGGSFGIAFMTTMSERRQDFHQSRELERIYRVEPRAAARDSADGCLPSGAWLLAGGCGEGGDAAVLRATERADAPARLYGLLLHYCGGDAGGSSADAADEKL